MLPRRDLDGYAKGRWCGGHQPQEQIVAGGDAKELGLGYWVEVWATSRISCVAPYLPPGNVEAREDG